MATLGTAGQQTFFQRMAEQMRAQQAESDAEGTGREQPGNKSDDDDDDGRTLMDLTPKEFSKLMREATQANRPGTSEIDRAEAAFTKVLNGLAPMIDSYGLTEDQVRGIVTEAGTNYGIDIRTERGALAWGRIVADKMRLVHLQSGNQRIARGAQAAEEDRARNAALAGHPNAGNTGMPNTGKKSPEMQALEAMRNAGGKSALDLLDKNRK